jgi:hypothetical protein
MEEFVLICGLILMFSLPVIIAKIHYYNPKKYFKSSEDKGGYENPIRIFRKVTKFDAKRIGIFPRITIRNAEISDLYNPEHLIFDSSDYNVIYKTFGLYDFPQELRIGTKIKFKDTRILPESVEVLFYQYYDDYSDKVHTDVYEGEPTPYNIQIMVSAKII